MENLSIGDLVAVSMVYYDEKGRYRPPIDVIGLVIEIRGFQAQVVVGEDTWWFSLDNLRPAVMLVPCAEYKDG